LKAREPLLFSFYLLSLLNKNKDNQMEYNEQRLIKAKNVANAKGGECLSTEYTNVYAVMIWKCSCQNHKPWNATYNNVVNVGSWCPECQYKNHGLQRAQEYATSKGGECLSNKYQKAVEKLLWKCACKNHKPWRATYNSVINSGTWCPECAIKTIKNPKGLEIAKEYAKSKGGDCLSTEYLGSSHPMIWKCSCTNHKPWPARYSSVMNTGSWCPECANNIKKG
jgi:hypothetical protein